MGAGGLFGTIGFGGGGTFITDILYILLGVIILASCGGGIYFFIRRKKHWNIKIEFKIPRNIKKVRTRDGQIKILGTLNKEWGKGYYDTKGVVYLKRKKKKPLPMKPFDIKQYLSNDNILTVVQVGLEDYRPVRDESYIELKDIHGNEGALVQAIIDTSESKSWKNTFEREAKEAYSLKSWINEHGALIAMGIVLLMNLVGFSIVISRIK